MKLKTKLSNWILALYARFLDKAQHTEWWKAHLQRVSDKKWIELRAEAVALVKGEDKQIAHLLPLIDNVINQLKISSAAESTDSAPWYTKSFNEMVVKTTALLLNKYVLLNKIVSVQPLQGPVGLVYYMTYGMVEKPEHENKVMTLQVIKGAVEAKTRKYQARWGVETMQDLHAVHGLDFAAEIRQAIAAEIASEIFNEVIYDLAKMGEENKYEVDLSQVNDFVESRPMKLLLTVNKAASLIAHKTRRGAGNFIICSPMAVSVLQSTPKSVFVPAASEERLDSDVSTLEYVGILNGTMRVYCSLSPSVETQIVVGYHGSAGCDSGYVHSPYIPLMTSGVVIDPNTFYPVVTAMTRYGKLTFAGDGDAALSDSKNYYAVVDFKDAKNLFFAPSVDGNLTEGV